MEPQKEQQNTVKNHLIWFLHVGHFLRKCLHHANRFTLDEATQITV